MVLPAIQTSNRIDLMKYSVSRVTEGGPRDNSNLSIEPFPPLKTSQWLQILTYSTVGKMIFPLDSSLLITTAISG